MKIVHVSSVHPWTDNRVHYREAVTLKEAGHNVYLIAVETEVAGPESGVEVITLPNVPRSRRVIVSTVRAVSRALRLKPDAVHLHDPELVWAIPLFRLMGKKVVYDAHEDLPNQVIDKPYIGRFTRPFILFMAHAVVKFASLSNRIVVATSTIGHRFPPHKTVLVRNYPALRPKQSSLIPVNERHDDLVYVGGISNNRGADVMIDAMTDINMPEKWSLILAGNMSKTLMGQVESHKGWDFVDYLGQVSPDRARELMSEAKVGLCVLKSTPAHIDSLPTKLFEYLAEGTPVIVSNIPLWRSIIEKYDCGVWVDENSPSAVATAVKRYADNPELLSRHSRNARYAAETDLNWSEEARVLLDMYAALL